MGNRQDYIAHQIVKYCHKLDEKGFGANHDGNISAKLDDVLLATPTAVSKGNVESEMIITLDMDGKKLAGTGNPFSEIKLHLAAYRFDERIQAVIHAHPPFLTARGLVNLSLRPNLPEAIVSIGDEIPVTPFMMPGASEQDGMVQQALQRADVFMMPGNGVLAVGDSVEQAYLRLELAEHVAKIQFYADQMGSPMTLSETNRETLLQKRASLGLGSQQKVIEKKSDDLTDTIRKLIQSEMEKL